MKFFLLILAFCISIVNAKGGIVLGAGLHTCGKYLDLLESDPNSKIVYNQYIEGVATGMSIQENKMIDKFKGSNTNDIQRWLKNYCEKNPLDLYIYGVMNIIRELDSN